MVYRFSDRMELEISGYEAANDLARAYSVGVVFPSELCGRSSLYSARQAAVIARA